VTAAGAYGGFMGRLRRRLRPIAVVVRGNPRADIAIAAVVLAVTLLTAAAEPDRGELSPHAAGVAALAAGALVWRRRWPFPVLVVTVGAAEAYLRLSAGQEVVLAAPLIALYTVADRSPRRLAPTVAVLVVVTFVGLHALVAPDRSWSLLGAQNLALAALGGLAVAAGEASRSRRAYTAMLEDRARRAEQDRDTEARRRVAEERLRIARDVHDTVGHHIALINVQAGVAAHELEERPEQSRQALTTIRQISRAALADVRATIGLLRQPGDPAAPVEPILGLAGLGDLLGSLDRAGLSVQHHAEGTQLPLPPAVDLSAYRIIQEALTNVRKHADTTRAVVRISHRPDELRIIIDDDGPLQPVANGDGHGLVGMRERAAAVGGTLTAGPRPDGGFRVAATLPLASSTHEVLVG
jgi:signal transduction histidine kinase